jgi:hypothetical protein
MTRTQMHPQDPGVLDTLLQRQEELLLRIESLKEEISNLQSDEAPPASSSGELV